MGKIIDVKYIDSKKYESKIIWTEGEIFIIDNKETIEEIKESIIDILECTNIDDELKKEKENSRIIYEIEKDVSKHIMGVFPKNIDLEEKKAIVKNVIIEKLNINNNTNAVILKGGKIYIIDSGVICNSKKNELDRYNGCDEESIEYIKNEFILEKNFGKKILKEVLNELKSYFVELKDEKKSDFLNNDYKGYLLNGFIDKLKNDKKYKQEDLDIDLIKAISGKLLREDFNNAVNSIFNFFYNDFLINKIDQNIIKINIKEEILSKYFNFKNKNIRNQIIDNLTLIDKIYKIELSKEIKKQIKNIYGGKIKLELNVLNIIENIFFKNTSNNKKEIFEEIMKNFINIVTENIKNKKLSLPAEVLPFINTLYKNGTTIKLDYIKTEQDIYKIKDLLINSIQDKIITEQKIKSNEYKISNIQKEKDKIKDLNGIEQKIIDNNKKIEELLIILGAKNIKKYNLSLKIEEVKRNLEDELLNIENNIKFTNESKFIINKDKIINEYIKYKNKLKKNEEKINEIENRQNENRKLNIDKKKYEENKILLDYIKKKNEKLSINLNKKENEINQIIKGLENAIIKLGNKNSN